ncbi:MAG: hypothetical protein ACOCVM_04925, partial [Desulfovibrionaceae bacterium]
LSAINQGKPLALSAPKSPVLKTVREMVRELAGEARPDKKPAANGLRLFGRSRKSANAMAPQPA